jgi:type VI secretion system protein ImpH
MAAEDRTATQALEFEKALEATPYKFSFFQALRRLAVLYRDRPTVGKSARPVDDPIRLSQTPYLEFAPSSLAAYQPSKEGRPPRLVAYFLGLLGPNGPLPIHITEFIRDRIRHNEDHTSARFLDIFHHRILSMFYRAWADAQPTVHLDRPESDRFQEYVGSLFGLGSPAFHNRDAVPDSAKRFHAGTLACQTRHADGLCAMLADFFRVPVEIQEFVSHWMELPDDCQTQLARSPSSGKLGHGAILGRRVWECQNKFRIIIGPVDFHDYQRLLPGGDSLTKLTAFVKNYVGDELEWDLQLVLKKQERPALQLGRAGQLRRTAWLANRPGQNDADDLVLTPLTNDNLQTPRV